MAHPDCCALELLIQLLQALDQVRIQLYRRGAADAGRQLGQRRRVGLAGAWASDAMRDMHGEVCAASRGRDCGDQHPSHSGSPEEFILGHPDTPRGPLQRTYARAGEQTKRARTRTRPSATATGAMWLRMLLVPPSRRAVHTTPRGGAAPGARALMTAIWQLRII